MAVPMEATRKRKGGPVIPRVTALFSDPSSTPSTEVLYVKKVRPQNRDSDCEMLDGGVAAAGVQPRRSL